MRGGVIKRKRRKPDWWSNMTTTNPNVRDAQHRLERDIHEQRQLGRYTYQELFTLQQQGHL
jgi:hypothetical protein